MKLQEQTIGKLIVMRAENLPVPHAFTTRFGGVSQGIFQALNLGEHRGDAPEHVEENYNLLCRALGVSPQRLVFSHQVHGKQVRAVTEKDCHTLFAPVPYEADGLVTNVPGLALVIFSADCVPILLYDPVKQCIGACHAGWRGTALNIVAETVHAMETQYGSKPGDLCAAVGPAIGPCCFETDEDVPNALIAQSGELCRPYIQPAGAGRYRCDLKGINGALLQAAGVRNVAISTECTCCSHEKYWSHRYTKGQRGSQGAVIQLPE